MPSVFKGKIPEHHEFHFLYISTYFLNDSYKYIHILDYWQWRSFIYTTEQTKLITKKCFLVPNSTVETCCWCASAFSMFK